MAHEDEYMTLPAGKRHKPTRGQMSLEDEDEKVRREIKFRESLAFAASYMQKIRSKQAATSSSSHITPVSTRASSHNESRTPATSLLSTTDAGRPASGRISRGRLSFRPSNASGLADLANKNTISRDNTTGDEEREAKLLAKMGKKICNTSQQATKSEAGHGEWRNRGSRVRRGLSEALDEDLAQLEEDPFEGWGEPLPLRMPSPPSSIVDPEGFQKEIPDS
ncbi:hypothetical protein INS49_004068 [Diaporthe citri]|uniref:uncharacterized protein n=1 Tax=Diaporthe citri TaxID=83186 RepID=UPI001C8011B4|nr:uncharacterized protein INS49_004068 [Diaporthe citri]KAG6354987.1 hypothetical protein INS49_004068 [Diaporthe citri]